KLGGIKKWVRFVEKKIWTRNYSLYCYPLDWWKSLIWRMYSHYQTVTIYFFLKKTFLLRGQRDINWNPKVFSIQLSFATFLFEVKPATFISSVGNGGTMTWVKLPKNTGQSKININLLSHERNTKEIQFSL